MAKNLKALLGDVHRYMGLLGLVSDDVRFVVVMTSVARVELSKDGASKLVKKLKLSRDSRQVSFHSLNHEPMTEIRLTAGVITWYLKVNNRDVKMMLDVLFPPRRATPKKPRAARTSPGQSFTWRSPPYETTPEQKPRQEPPRQPPPGPSGKPFPQPAPPVKVPRDSREARAFVRTFYKLSVATTTDLELLRYAKSGQISYHPERLTGDPILSRAFNAAASFLKGAAG